MVTIVEANSDLKTSPNYGLVSTLSWITSLQDTTLDPEDPADRFLSLPQAHRSLQSHRGGSTDLSQAVVPATSYTGRWRRKKNPLVSARLPELHQRVALLCPNRKWPHSTVAVSAGASDRSAVSFVYPLDGRRVGVQADRS